MATGDSADILDRVKKLLPARWFAWVAPNRDAILGALSDIGAWCYSWIIYARLQSRIATGTDIWLDIISLDFLGRAILRQGASDSVFRALITATILKERVTRHGMFQAVKTLTGNDPVIFEPWSAGDAGAYSNFSLAQSYGQMGYGVGRGGYGSYQFPGQVFMKVIRGASSGVPSVTGYGYGYGGYKGSDVVSGQASFGGQIEFIGSYTRLVGITDQQIENLITYTKPSGTTVWLQFV
jgi:hypothetical protein